MGIAGTGLAVDRGLCKLSLLNVGSDATVSDSFDAHPLCLGCSVCLSVAVDWFGGKLQCRTGSNALSTPAHHSGAIQLTPLCAASTKVVILRSGVLIERRVLTLDRGARVTLEL